MILTFAWLVVAVVGIVTQWRLFVRARFGATQLDRRSLTAAVARLRERAAAIRVLVFSLALGTGIFSLIVYPWPPWFSLNPISVLLVLILAGFMVNGLIDAYVWRRIDRAIRRAPGSRRDWADLEVLEEFDRQGGAR